MTPARWWWLGLTLAACLTLIGVFVWAASRSLGLVDCGTADARVIQSGHWVSQGQRVPRVRQQTLVATEGGERFLLSPRLVELEPGQSVRIGLVCDASGEVRFKARLMAVG